MAASLGVFVFVLVRKFFFFSFPLLALKGTRVVSGRSSFNFLLWKPSPGQVESLELEPRS